MQIWWSIGDSNSSPIPCHGSALPNELMPHTDIAYHLSNSTATSVFSRVRQISLSSPLVQGAKLYKSLKPVYGNMYEI